MFGGPLRARGADPGPRRSRRGIREGPQRPGASSAEFDHLLRTYAGRPTTLTDVPRFAEQAGGARVILKREDLTHTGAHKINNVLGQALLTKRLGKKRVIAETGAGQHGVATATAARPAWVWSASSTWAPSTAERQALNVARMKLLGATVVPVTNGSQTLKDAINEAFRDWVTNVDSTHYLFGTVAGRYPFLGIVRDFARIIGVEARRQMLELTGSAARRGVRLRSAAAPTPSASSTPSSATRASGCTATRPGAEGLETGEHAAHPDRRARSASCTARAPTCCRTTRARPSSPTRSPPASTTRASARSTPGSRTAAGPTYRGVTDAEAMDAFALLARTEGIIPAIEIVARPGRRAQAGPRARPRRHHPGQPVRSRRQGHGAPR